MSVNRGKEFEHKFFEDWTRCFKDSFILRLYDPGFGMRGISNPCDFICFVNKHLYLIETKTIHGNSFPISNLSQYDKLLGYKNIPGLIACVLIWYIDHDKIVAVPIETFEHLKSTGKKSLNIKTISDTPGVVNVPVYKKRVFLDADYTSLELLFGEDLWVF